MIKYELVEEIVTALQGSKRACSKEEYLYYLSEDSVPVISKAARSVLLDVFTKKGSMITSEAAAEEVFELMYFVISCVKSDSPKILIVSDKNFWWVASESPRYLFVFTTEQDKVTCKAQKFSDLSFSEKQEILLDFAE